MNRIFLLAAALELAGCVSAEQEQFRQHEAQVQYERYMNTLAIQCKNYGFTPKTPEFAQCMQQADAAEQQRRNAIGAALIGSGYFNRR